MADLQGVQCKISTFQITVIFYSEEIFQRFFDQKIAFDPKIQDKPPIVAKHALVTFESLSSVVFTFCNGACVRARTQQDLAPAHKSNLAQEWCEENCPEFIPKEDAPPAFVEWPVEEFFNLLKHQVYSKGRPETMRALKSRIRAACRDPSWTEWLQKTFATMPDRMKAVIEAKGWHTKY